MKIIEALKKVKHDREKIVDLQRLINKNAARMESEKPEYEDQKKRVAEWIQSIEDTNHNISKLLTHIQKTNLLTTVTIDIGGKQVQKTIAEWIIRRREGVDVDLRTGIALSVGKLIPKPITDSEGKVTIDQVVVNFDPKRRDESLAILREEKYLIDSALEIVNATTDLVE